MSAASELSILTEYCKALKPMAQGLDNLQGEDDCYYGTLLPTLETTLNKMKSRCAIIAAVIVPKFKLR